MKYQIDDKVVNTEKAEAEHCLDEWDGHNMACGGTGRHKTLYRSSKIGYYVVHNSDWQGQSSYAESISKDEAYSLIYDADRENIVEMFGEKYVKEKEEEEA